MSPSFKQEGVNMEKENAEKKPNRRTKKGGDEGMLQMAVCKASHLLSDITTC